MCDSLQILEVKCDVANFGVERYIEMIIVVHIGWLLREMPYWFLLCGVVTGGHCMWVSEVPPFLLETLDRTLVHINIYILILDYKHCITSERLTLNKDVKLTWSGLSDTIRYKIGGSNINNLYSTAIRSIFMLCSKSVLYVKYFQSSMTAAC